MEGGGGAVKKVWRVCKPENANRRVLGALRFVNDVDDTPIRTPLHITTAPQMVGQASDPKDAAPLRMLRNRFGLHVIQTGQGFESYVNVFDPPPTAPPLEDLIARLRVTDPSGFFLPADFDVRLPRA